MKVICRLSGLGCGLMIGLGVLTWTGLVFGMLRCIRQVMFEMVNVVVVIV